MRGERVDLHVELIVDRIPVKLFLDNYYGIQSSTVDAITTPVKQIF